MSRPPCLVLYFLYLLSLVGAETFSVKIETENHVNIVDAKFVSFTIEPKFLFLRGEKTTGQESICMAASLAPAYLRIAGPSTSHLTFHNTSMTLDDLDTELPEPNKQKRHLFPQIDDLNSNEDEGLLSKLKKSSQKLKKPKRTTKDVEQSALDSNESLDLLSKLKKSSQKRMKQKPDSSESEKLLEIDSHDSLLSKLKKPKSGGLLKLKRFKDSEELTNDRLKRSSAVNLEVSHRQWRRFVKWAKDTGFNLVFAVNNGEKTENGMWDPNPALNMLTVADRDKVGDIFWQLGYECTNQTIEDYLNDLQTLRVMVDTFADRKWKVVGGDISRCLQEESKSDFRDYITLSSEMMDAVLLNGNSSSRELSRMSAPQRLSLLQTLSTSTTPLWLTESPQLLSEAGRAADWITSLGYSARNGFTVHFRELMENELYEPTLSFYMALLYKNLVGERVLDITIDNSESNTALFAHCTSLRHKAVPGAVTLYGVNMDSEPARFSVKLTKREEGGDIMQFILGHDHNGNIVVNGRAMFYEGDIRPVVKRVLPYKTLLLNLPPKSFGFWVLANTKVNACYDDEQVNATLVEAKPVDTDENKENKTDVVDEKVKTKSNVDASDEETKKVKRSISLDDLDIDLAGVNAIDNNEALENRIDSINRGLREVQGLFSNKKVPLRRVRRQVLDEDSEIRKKLRRHGLKKFKEDHKSIGSGIIEKLMNLPKLDLTKNLKELKLRKSPKLNKNKLSKRNSRNYRSKADDSQENETDNFLARRKRSLFTHDNKKRSGDTSENDIDSDSKQHFILANSCVDKK
ncbi:hypothetical protein MSG28_014043 [Choristoneura fumiferana]|uniref:Uncharacterized protein n=1 Tax=Choristoneura fumiferana TaxID=7141 RepID=A0ACC0JFU3_CHOFU|nr:hypothetical protein MSG28_014043 [Choristoneura fumiferana]